MIVLFDHSFGKSLDKLHEILLILIAHRKDIYKRLP